MQYGGEPGPAVLAPSYLLYCRVSQSVQLIAILSSMALESKPCWVVCVCVCVAHQHNRHQGPEIPTNLIRVTQHFLLGTSTEVVNQHHRSLLPLRHTTLSHKHIKVSQPLINSRVSG